MKTLLVLSIISQVYAPRPQQQWGPPEQQWGSPEQDIWGPPQSEWGPQPPEEQLQWGPPQSEGQPEWHPRPENQCKCVPKNAKTIAITPIVEVGVVADSVYSCDSTSKVKELSHQATTKASKVTCNGIIVSTRDGWIDVVYAEPTYGGKQKDRVTITNYTKIKNYNNGNRNYYECGTIASGRCAGDKIWGVSIAQANDQTGCCKGGNTGNVVIYRTYEINGKCESRCSLGRSSHSYAEPVSNRGLTLRTLENEETTPKSD